MTELSFANDECVGNCEQACRERRMVENFPIDAFLVFPKNARLLMFWAFFGGDFYSGSRLKRLFVQSLISELFGNLSSAIRGCGSGDHDLVILFFVIADLGYVFAHGVNCHLLMLHWTNVYG